MYRKKEAMIDKEQIERLNQKMREDAKQNPIQYVSRLFMGGSVDGQWLDIPERTDVFDVTRIIPLFSLYRTNESYPERISCVPTPIDRYIRYVLQDDAQRYSVMILADTQGNIIQQLIQGYRK